MKNQQITVIIKTFTARNRNFTIVKDDDGYFQAIEDKYIDANGKTTQELYGFQTFANKDLNACLQSTKNQVEIDYLISQGRSKAEAFGIVFDLIDKVSAETLESLFA